MSGSAPRIAGEFSVGVRVVIGLVVGPVGDVELLESSDGVLDGRVGRQVENHRLDLGAQEVVGATRAERGEPRVLRAGEEVEHHVGVGEVAHHRAVGRREAADGRRERGGLGATFGGGERAVALEGGAERLGLAVLGDVRGGGVDDLEGVRLGLVGGVAPGGDAVPAEDAADRLRVRRP